MNILKKKRAVLIFGVSGLIGSALFNCLSNAPGMSGLVSSITWSEIEPIFAKNSLAKLRAFILERVNNRLDVDIVFAGGLTDSNQPQDELFRSNVEFPAAIIEATLSMEKVRYLTLGTIQENFSDLCQSNSYFSSKRQLAVDIKRWASLDTTRNNRFLHLQLHTVYGAQVRPHMFSGMMIQALLTNEIFKMSAGDQLREYHHADDIAIAIQSILNYRWVDVGPVLAINSGEAIKLIDLARGVFQELGKCELLRVGEIAAPTGENIELFFARSPEWVLPSSRDPVLGIVNIVKMLQGFTMVEKIQS